MRALERPVGTPLFTRAGRTFRLTEAGELLARHAVDILDGLEAAAQHLTALKELRAGRVRVCAAFPSASTTIIVATAASLSGGA